MNPTHGQAPGNGLCTLAFIVQVDFWGFCGRDPAQAISRTLGRGGYGNFCGKILTAGVLFDVEAKDGISR